jgi:hypothetical protein
LLDAAAADSPVFVVHAAGVVVQARCRLALCTVSAGQQLMPVSVAAVWLSLVELSEPRVGCSCKLAKLSRDLHSWQADIKAIKLCEELACTALVDKQ